MSPKPKTKTTTKLIYHSRVILSWALWGSFGSRPRLPSISTIRHFGTCI